jgi:hypothetical protein
MGLLFKDDLLDEFGSWPIAYIPYGGADFGEIAAVAKAVGDGDGSAFHQAWAAAGDRFAAEADAAERRGAIASARELFLRARRSTGGSGCSTPLCYRGRSRLRAWRCPLISFRRRDLSTCNGRRSSSPMAMTAP